MDVSRDMALTQESSSGREQPRMTSQDLWYTLGYTLESIRLRWEARREGGENPSPGRYPSPDLLERLLGALSAAGAGLLVHHLLRGRTEERRPAHGLRRVLAGGSAGALAGAVTELLRPAFTAAPHPSPLPRALGRALLRGAARGMTYAGLVAPRLRGPRALRGSTFGALEYLLAPWGGLGGVAGRRGKGGGVGHLSSLAVPRGVQEPEAFLSLLAFGILLAHLYE